MPRSRGGDTVLTVRTEGFPQSCPPGRALSRRCAGRPMSASVQPASPAADFGDEKNLAVGGQLFEIGVLIDLAVDRHRHPLVDLLPEAGIAPIELKDQAPHVVRLDIELALPAGEPAGIRAGDDDVRHPYSAAKRVGSTVSIASRRRGGDIGRSRMRVPVASAIAL